MGAMPQKKRLETELRALKDESCEYLHHPSLDELEKANDFKTPLKVRVKLDMKSEVGRQPIQCGPIPET
jgi:hypothetical protein